MEVNIKWGDAHTELKTKQSNSKVNNIEYKTHNIGKILDTTNLKILGCLQTSTKKQIPAHYVPGCHRVIKHGGLSQNV